ncbi:UNVERIFIED_CONTAM: hypothetical protein Slati_1949700 [Sesamum latifolium]|uniref:Reverse transcriptase RNase H-like domain-containing protein n=1 Tax=Sesamum latifolium TaxID=2727402 RepID=A0AAW2X326_9LAMI
MVTQRGIEANPLKIKAIIDMKAPTCLNEAQRLTGRIAALSRFISKSAEKSLPFFKTEAPSASKAFTRGTLYLYLSVAPQAVSSILVREEDGKQLPIYYVSKVLNGAEGRYTPIEKMALALVVTARRTTIKAQALADFVLEMAEITIKDAYQDQKWLLHVDGSSTAQGSGADIVITTPQGMRMAHETGAKHLLAYSDSQLVVKQVEGTYEAKEENSLSKIASSLEDCRTRHITIPYLPEARTPLAVQPIITGEDWKTPIIKWIEEDYSLKSMGSCQAQDTSHSFHNARTYPLQEVLYAPATQMLSIEEGIHILQEIHSGCCGAHAGTRILANKALRAGYFWPTMKQDAIRLWGMDIVGPFPLAAGQRKFLLVAIDYFTKWVEAEPLARITEGEAEEYKNGVKACTSGKDSPQWLILKPTGKSKSLIAF